MTLFSYTIEKYKLLTLTEQDLDVLQPVLKEIKKTIYNIKGYGKFTGGLFSNPLYVH